MKRYAPAREIDRAATKVKVTSGFPKNIRSDIKGVNESTRFVYFGDEGAKRLLVR